MNQVIKLLWSQNHTPKEAQKIIERHLGETVPLETIISEYAAQDTAFRLWCQNVN